MFCYRDYQLTTRLNQQNEKSASKEMFEVYCRNIIPYMYLYKHQVEYYEKTVYEILDRDIGLILPKFEDREKNVKQKRQNRQIISALISGFIGLVYETS